nr:TcmI family type II polyketide cyclase [Kibdelosporangium sp. MJ126-NF4]CEL19968.1 Polyketide cyclase WhiE VII [Kibdelosporangium sp. MJ126-NF4]CTQ97192.1 Polyketide cyclase WhiE VII [Kibdelosporangium sp. MJ126-NF4]
MQNDRALIVARMTPGAEREVGRLFADSDATDLPHDLDVRRRHLFAYQGLYFHYVEFGGDGSAAMRTAGQRPDFKELSEGLSSFIKPYDPVTWRSPADAMATEFYRWTPGDER